MINLNERHNGIQRENRRNNYPTIHNDKVMFHSTKIFYLHQEDCISTLHREDLSLGFFLKSGQVLSFLRHSAIILKLCRRDKSQKQCKDPTHIKLAFCRQERHTCGLQYIKDLGSRESEIICSAKLDLDLREDLEFYLYSNPVTSIKFPCKSGLKRKLQLLASSAFS